MPKLFRSKKLLSPAHLIVTKLHLKLRNLLYLNFLFPLFATVYADGQQMLTFTGIVLDNHAEEENIKKALSSFPHNTFAWDNPCYIEIPTLSVKELIELNARMPDENIRDILSSDFDFIFPRGKENARDSYISYYKYYPNFHKISL